MKQHVFILLNALCLSLLVGCGGSGGGNGNGSDSTEQDRAVVDQNNEPENEGELSGPQVPAGSEGDFFTITVISSSGGSVSPGTFLIAAGTRSALTVTADSGSSLENISGCNGSLSGTNYTTGIISSNCSITANFVPALDQDYVAFVANQSSTGPILMSVPINGNGLNTLSPVLAFGGAFLEFKWSPKGDRIVYLAEKNNAGTSELFSVLADGSDLQTLNDSLAFGGKVIDFKWSPDGTKIAYRANQNQADKIDLYTIDPTGLNRIKINSSAGDVSDYNWSLDGNSILYEAGTTIDEQFDLIISTKDGAIQQQINSSLAAQQKVIAKQWSPMGKFVSYVVQNNGAGKILYVYEIETAITETIGARITRPVDKAVHVWSADDAYLAIAESRRPSEGVDGLLHLISTDDFDLNYVQLDPASLTRALAFNPIDSSILVVADRADDQSTVYHFSKEGIEINRAALVDTQRSETPTEIFFSPDNQQAVLHSSIDSWLYSTETGLAMQLIDGSQSTDKIAALAWSQNSNHLFYMAERSSTPSIVSNDGSSLTALDGFTISEQERSQIRWINNRLVYKTSTGGALNGSTIISVNITGNDPIVLGTLPVSSSGPSFEIIDSYTSSSNNEFIVYDLQSKSNNNGDALYYVNTTGTGNIHISSSLPSGTKISGYAIQPIN